MKAPYNYSRIFYAGNSKYLYWDDLHVEIPLSAPFKYYFDNNYT